MYNILMIDDNPLAHTMIKKMLAGNKKVDSTAHSFEAAPILEYLVANRHDRAALPDIIFLDLQMPVMNGWEFLLHFNAIHQSLAKEIRIYIISAAKNYTAQLNPHRFSFVKGYLGKPFSRERFYTALSGL